MSHTDQPLSLETRAFDALAALSGLIGAPLHQSDAVLAELVAEAESIVYRLRTTTVASDNGILRVEAVKVAALIHSAFSGRPHLAPPEAPPEDTTDAAHT